MAIKQNVGFTVEHPDFIKINVSIDCDGDLLIDTSDGQAFVGKEDFKDFLKALTALISGK